jgi:hypothetical protein
LTDWIPFRWPKSWTQSAGLDLIKGTHINCLIMDASPLADQAAQSGFKVTPPGKAPEGVTLLEGVWPGIRLSASGRAASSGPTGEPWVDSNAAPVRIALARNPGAPVWVRATPRDNGTTNPEPFVTAMADSAIAGGRWIISLNDALSEGLAAGKPEAQRAWSRITAAAGFFASHAWAGYAPQAVCGILSDFATAQSREVVNLIARSGQQYRVLLRQNLAASSLAGLKAIVCPDAVPPEPAVRSLVRGFVNSGGLLIAEPAWGSKDGTGASTATHPRYSLSTLGKGTLAIAKAPSTNPYLAANDVGTLISHRQDLLRFWNGGPLSAVYSASPDHRRAVVQIVFYSARSGASTSLRVAGNYASAKFLTLDAAAAPASSATAQKSGTIELNLPDSSGYVAIELEA